MAAPIEPVTLVGVGENINSSPAPNPLTVSAHPDTQEGDLMFMVMRVVVGSVSTFTWGTPPAGWTLAAEKREPQAAGLVWAVANFYKVATASEPSSYTFTYTPPSGYSGGGSRGHIYTFRNVDTDNPLGYVLATNGGDDLMPTVTFPSIDVERDGSALVYALSTPVARAHTPPSGFTEDFDSETVLSTGHKLNVDAGATGTITMTISSGGTRWVQSMALIQPPPVKLSAIAHHYRQMRA